MGKKYNDYGQGFYCTEANELAKEWACPVKKDGFSNKYALDLNKAQIDIVLRLAKALDCNITDIVN